MNTTQIIAILSIVISLLAATLSVRNAKKPLRFKRIEIITDLLSQLLNIVDPVKNGWSELLQEKYVSSEHSLIETKLRLWLLSSEQIEVELREEIIKLRTNCKQEKDIEAIRERILKLHEYLVANNKTLVS
jgi:ribosomal protein L6P/L9E